MAQTCGQCGASNRDSNGFCPICGNHLPRSVEPLTDYARDRPGRASGPLMAIVLIGVLLLSCLGIIGVALVDELAPAHPLRTLLLGAPTASPSSALTVTPSVAVGPTPSSTVEPGRDAFEPDDTISEASEIRVDGTLQSHTLSPAGDRDYISFRVRQGMVYTVETGNLACECDTVLTLYDEHETELTTDDDDGNAPWASRLTWVAKEDSSLVVEVTQYGEVSGKEAPRYDVWVSESEPVTSNADEYEPDDTIAEATELRLGVPQTHSIHVLGDCDWVSFRVERGLSYDIETFNLGGDIDTIIYLYDADGEELAQDDDGGEEDITSRIIWSAATSGTLYAMIRDYRNGTIEPDMQYSVAVAESAPSQADAFEPDDTQEEASQIETGLYQSHNLHVTGDRDWIYFQALGGTTYIIETLRLGGRIDTVIHLYNAGGQALASDDDGGDESLSSALVWTAADNGPLYVSVQDLSDARAGPGTEYVISVREEGAPFLSPDRYEPDDATAEASEIAVGEIQAHNIHVAGDHDWLYFQATEGTTYIIETFDLGPDVDTVVFVYDGQGDELAGDDDGADEPRASRIRITAVEPGTLYLMARDYKDDRAEGETVYSISVNENEPDQPALALVWLHGLEDQSPGSSGRCCRISALNVQK